jgi:hypothetical protein
MAKKKISIKYVQMVERSPTGLLIIGRPIKKEFAIKVKKELFGNNPNVSIIPSMPPIKKRLKKVI